MEGEGEGVCADLEYKLNLYNVHRGLNHAIIYYSNGDK